MISSDWTDRPCPKCHCRLGEHSIDRCYGCMKKCKYRAPESIDLEIEMEITMARLDEVFKNITGKDPNLRFGWQPER